MASSNVFRGPRASRRLAVRLTYLDGTDRVTDLGHARLSIRNSRLEWL